MIYLNMFEQLHGQCLSYLQAVSSSADSRRAVGPYGLSLIRVRMCSTFICQVLSAYTHICNTHTFICTHMTINTWCSFFTKLLIKPACVFIFWPLEGSATSWKHWGKLPSPCIIIYFESCLCPSDECHFNIDINIILVGIHQRLREIFGH